MAWTKVRDTLHEVLAEFDTDGNNSVSVMSSLWLLFNTDIQNRPDLMRRSRVLCKQIEEEKAEVKGGK